MDRPTVLITGATGILGSYVAGEALNLGWKPTVVMRDQSLAQARERLAAVLRLVGHDGALDDIRIVLGDTRHPSLGLRQVEAGALRADTNAMIHCAACTSFSRRANDEIRATNIGGVRNVIDFLDGAGIPLYHVSTAYVAGDRGGLATESDLDRGQDFTNTYEWSKFQAEHLVENAVASGRLRAAIFRPSIIVGASQHGRITQFLNFYSFLRLIDMASTRGTGEACRIRVAANPEATKNLVPVDWTAQALWHIIEAEGPSGQTYHLTNPRPLRQQALLDWANHRLEAANMRLEFVPEVTGETSPFEEAVSTTSRHYHHYLQTEPLFDRANTERALGAAHPFPEMGADVFEKLLDFARAQRWQGIFGCLPDPIGIETEATAKAIAHNTKAHSHNVPVRC